MPVETKSLKKYWVVASVAMPVGDHAHPAVLIHEGAAALGEHGVGVDVPTPREGVAAQRLAAGATPPRRAAAR
jgi:hypothetical protein